MHNFAKLIGKNMKKYRIGIIGAGHIARKMATTLAQMPVAECYAIASRDLARAEAFRQEFGIVRAYGSYEELVADPEVDLVYIATPHTLHYAHARLCILHGKPVLCEKAFMANARQAEDILELAHRRRVFITEAIWTRYMPLSRKMQELLQDGAIGIPRMLTANLGYAVAHKERLVSPSLGGGALLDLGVYVLNFAAMAFGPDVVRTLSACIKTDSGVDAQDSITLFYPGERMAQLSCSMYARTDRQGIVSGEEGYLMIENLNNPEAIRLIGKDYQLVEEFRAPHQITGFEYQIQASIEALENGWLESPYMPHAETLRIMRQMDALRDAWGVHFPCDS